MSIIKFIKKKTCAEIEDSARVARELQTIAAKSRRLGLFLGIPAGELDNIFAVHGIDLSQCLEGVVREFLENDDKPTWRKIVQAVKPLHGSLAKKIADQHKGIANIII